MGFWASGCQGQIMGIQGCGMYYEQGYIFFADLEDAADADGDADDDNGAAEVDTLQLAVRRHSAHGRNHAAGTKNGARSFRQLAVLSSDILSSDVS